MRLPRVLERFCVVNVILTTLLFPPGYQSAIFDRAFLKTRVQGTYLEHYRTQYDVRSPFSCASECVDGRVSLLCRAFSYYPLDRMCEFYKKGDNLVLSSNVHVFLIQNTGVWRTVSVKGRLYSFYLSAGKKTYAGARAHCHGVGGYLFHADSRDDYEALGMLDFDEQHWLAYVGANDQASEGVWVTEKDNTQLDTNVWNWRPGSPDNYRGNENCGAMFMETLLLGDIGCQKYHAALCERDV